MGSYEFGAASLLTRDCPSIRQLILPIENVAFSVECQGEGRVFQLKNESQTTLRSFWVEGSLDGETFSAISERLSFEENTSTLEIALPAIAQQQQYFRLAKQDENTSDLAYSQIRQQLPCENAGMQVSLYPSHVADWLIFRISGTESLAFNVTVVDLAGKVLLQMKADAQGEMDLRNLPSGVYLLRVDDWAGNAEVVRFMKM